jgi:hypothetical protein
MYVLSKRMITPAEGLTDDKDDSATEFCQERIVRFSHEN